MIRKAHDSDRVSDAYRIASEARAEGVAEGFCSSARLVLRGGWPEVAHWLYSELLRRMPTVVRHPDVSELGREIETARAVVPPDP